MAETPGTPPEESEEKAIPVKDLLVEVLQQPEGQQDPELVAALTALVKAGNENELEFFVTRSGVIKEMRPIKRSPLRSASRPPRTPSTPLH